MAVSHIDARDYQSALATGNRKVADRIGARLIDSNMGLVINRVERYRWMFGVLAFTDAREDLVQAGVLGLLEALRRYNPAKGAFSTLATFWIWYKVQDELTRMQVTSHPKCRQQEFRATPEEVARLQEHAIGLDPVAQLEASEGLDLVAEYAQGRPEAEQIFFSALLVGEDYAQARRVSQLPEAMASAAMDGLRSYIEDRSE